MPVDSLLYKSEYKINEKISIHIPTVEQVLQNESKYYGLIHLLTATPFDLMAQLDDVGIDFTQITDFELFMLLFTGIALEDTSLIFGDLDLSKFKPAVNVENNIPILIDTEHDIKIDKEIHAQITNVLRKIHHLKPCRKNPGNEEAKRYLIERAYKKLKRHKNKEYTSQLEPLIIAMVNSEQYKYNFESTKSLSIYQFNESVRQVIQKIEYDNKMYGVYSGAIKASDLSPDEFNWISI